jgi:transcriptional repressor NrdR
LTTDIWGASITRYTIYSALHEARNPLGAWCVYAGGSDGVAPYSRKWDSLNCPFCGSPDSKVIDSRETEIKEAIRRRRECTDCGQRFTTYEKIEEIPITVVKRDGGTELFHPEKLLRGLTRACTKRHVPMERLQDIVSDIERELREESAYEVSSERVGNMALERLQQVDLVAYVRFASVYRQFESIEEFKRELEELAKEGMR